MDKNLKLEFERDLYKGVLKILFEEEGLWHGSLDQAYMLIDIEADLDQFLRTKKIGKYIDLPSAEFSRAEMYELGDFIYSTVYSCEIPGGMYEYDYDNIDDEDDEPDIKLVDISGAVEITAHYIDWELDSIEAMFMSREGDESVTPEYMVWPSYNVLDNFNGMWGLTNEYW